MEDSRIEAIIQSHGSEPFDLIEVLQDIQEACGYLPEDVLRRVANSFEIPLSGSQSSQEICRIRLCRIGKDGERARGGRCSFTRQRHRRVEKHHNRPYQSVQQKTATEY